VRLSNTPTKFRTRGTELAIGMATQLLNATDSQTHRTKGDREVSAPWVRLTDKGNENCTEENVTSSNKSLTVDGPKRKGSTARKYFERLVIGVLVIATVWVLLVSPIALYHLTQVNLQQWE